MIQNKKLLNKLQKLSETKKELRRKILYEDLINKHSAYRLLNYAEQLVKCYENEKIISDILIYDNL
jgi:hypothetical protein